MILIDSLVSANTINQHYYSYCRHAYIFVYLYIDYIHINICQWICKINSKKYSDQQYSGGGSCKWKILWFWKSQWLQWSSLSVIQTVHCFQPQSGCNGLKQLDTIVLPTLTGYEQNTMFDVTVRFKWNDKQNNLLCNSGAIHIQS